MVLDVNGNGRPDAGEPVIPAGGVVRLAPGATARLVVTGQIPAGATPGQTAQVTLRAVSQLQGAAATNTDSLNVVSRAVVDVAYSASGAIAVQGTPLSFTARATNNGNAAASPAAITVNGAPASRFVLRAPVPLNTTFTSAQTPSNAGAQTLYHLQGSAANSYVTVLPAGSVVDSAAWGIASLPQAGVFQGQFDVMVNPDATGNVTGAAYADWTDAGAPQTTPSSNLVLPLPARAASLAFYTDASYANKAVQSTIDHRPHDCHRRATDLPARQAICACGRHAGCTECLDAQRGVQLHQLRAGTERQHLGCH